MIPVNRYLRDRHEKIQEAGSEKEIQNLPNRSEPLAELQGGETSGVSLKKIEKPQEIKLRAFAGGGIRNLKYLGTLSEKQLDRVEEFYPFYKQAEKVTQVNWKILAGIHYRESSLGLDPKAKGNQFQFDGDLKSKATGNLLSDLIQTGKILQSKAKAAKMNPLSPDQFHTENVAQALFGYNGKIYRQFVSPNQTSYDRSPYVLNRIDSKHLEMPIYLGKNTHPQWSIDHRLGVITFANELEKAFPGS